MNVRRHLRLWCDFHASGTSPLRRAPFQVLVPCGWWVPSCTAALLLADFVLCSLLHLFQLEPVLSPEHPGKDHLPYWPPRRPYVLHPCGLDSYLLSEVTRGTPDTFDSSSASATAPDHGLSNSCLNLSLPFSFYDTVLPLLHPPPLKPVPPWTSLHGLRTKVFPFPGDSFL